jgi:chitinase
MSKAAFPTPYAGAYYPIYGLEPNQPNTYFDPVDSTPFNKVSALFIAFAHAYPLDPADPSKGAKLAFQTDQPDQPGRLSRIMKFARHSNPDIKFIISLGWGMQDWTYINADYAGIHQNFAQSVVAFMQEYGFDGFDIDDESIGFDPAGCTDSSGCITQENFDGVIHELRSRFDARKDGQPYYLTITPAFGTGHVTQENMGNFDLINPQCYGGTTPSDFTVWHYPEKQLSWGIDTEGDLDYPDREHYENLAGIFNWSMSADRQRNFEYTNRIATDVGYPAKISSRP